MLSWYWALPSGDRALSRVDPFRLTWPDEFDRMSYRLEEDMRRRNTILEAMQDSMWKDYMLFFNNPERAQLDTQDFRQSINSSVEHYQTGKEHTFKRSLTIDGKNDTVTAKYDGDKTVVTYDGDKTVELPGFYDITVDVIKQGSEATRAVDEKLEQMNKQLRGKLQAGETQKYIEADKQQQEQKVTKQAS